MNEEQLIKITEVTEQKISSLFKQYPCILFDPNWVNNSSILQDICFNEKYINELGHSLESFATLVLQEGIPKY